MLPINVHLKNTGNGVNSRYLDTYRVSMEKLIGFELRAMLRAPAHVANPMSFIPLKPSRYRDIERVKIPTFHPSDELIGRTTQSGYQKGKVVCLGALDIS